MSKYDLFPDVYFCHQTIANCLVPGSVLDVGGIGRLKSFLTTLNLKITDANITAGIDGRNLPYKENEFANAVSINTLEHVDNHENFIREMIRVASKKVILCFPFAGRANEIEDVKKSIGHNHPIEHMPNIEELMVLFMDYKVTFTFANPWWMHLSFIAGMQNLPCAYINKNMPLDKWLPCDEENAITVFMEINL